MPGGRQHGRLSAWPRPLAACALLAVFACGEPAGRQGDARPDGSVAADAGAGGDASDGGSESGLDAGPPDAGGADAGDIDAGNADAGDGDAGSAPDGGAGCRSDSDCPDGRGCSPDETCVPLELLDRVPPGLAGLAQVAPPLGRAGTQFTVSFRATERLGESPRMHLPGGAAATCSSYDGVAWTCAYVATGSETVAAGGLAPFVLELVDVSRNRATVFGGALHVDFDPPSLAVVLVDPPVAGLGRDIVYVVVPDEPLAAPPVLHAAPLAFDLQPGTGYVFRHAVARGDPDTVLPVAIELQDLAGNTARLAGPSVRIDPKPPSIGSVVASPARLSTVPGHRELSILVETENADAPPATLQVLVAGRPAVCGAWDAATGTYRCGRTTTGEEPEGPATVRVLVRDAAGNETVDESSEVVFDFTEPGLVSASAEPRVARPGAAVTCTLAVDEPLSAPPSLVGILSFEAIAGTNWEFRHLVAPTDPEGEHPVRVFLLDLAGNSALAEGPTVRIDATPPAVGPVVASPGRISAQPGHDTLEVSIATESLDRPPASLDVRLGARAATCGLRDPVQGVYRCRYTASGAEPERRVAISISARDEAGNEATDASASVLFDFDPPALASAAVAPALAGLGARIVLSVAADEALGADPVLRVAGGIAFVPVAGTPFRFEHVVTRLDADGDHATTLDLVDVAGNPASVAGPLVRIDTAAPVLSSVTASPARLSTADGHSDLSIVVVAENPGPAPAGLSVRVGTGTATCGAWASSIGGFACTYHATGAEAEGTAVVAVVLRDAAGNETVDRSAATVFDFTPPRLVQAGVVPARARLGSEITLTATADEPLAAFPRLVVGDGSLVFAPVAGSRYAFVHVAGAQDPQGSLTTSLELVDLAGNAAAVAGPAVGIDTLAPVLSDVSAAPDRLSARDGHSDLAISFKAEDLGAPASLQVLVGARAAECSRDATLAGYRCTYQATGDEEEGRAAISIRARDAAGNEAQDHSLSVVFDFTPPAISSASLLLLPGADNPLGSAASSARAGTLVRAVVVADELLDPVVAPSLSAQGPGALAFRVVPAATLGATAVFEAVVPDGLSDGDYSLRLTWQDLVANDAALSPAAPLLRVKTSTPVLQVEQAQVLHVRSPRGNASAETVGARTVPAGPYFALVPEDAQAAAFPAATFRFAGGAPRRLRVWAEADCRTLLGSADAHTDGSWPLVSLGSDSANAFATGVDEAGNESAGILISNAEYVLTSSAPDGDAAVGLETHVHVVRAREQDPYLTSPADRAGLRGTDAASVLVRAEPAWRVRPYVSSGPPVCYGAYLSTYAMVYDPTRGRFLLACRQEDRTVSLWEWDGARWHSTAPAVSPYAKSAVVFVFDPVRDQGILFNQPDSLLGMLDDATWIWHDGEWSRHADIPLGLVGQPALPRLAVFDSAAGRVVVLGRADSPGAHWERAEWDGHGWTRLTMTGGNVTGTYWFLQGAAFDHLRNAVVVSIVDWEGATRIDQTWEVAGTAWIDRTPAQGVRAPAGPFVWDPSRRRVVALGAEASYEWTGTQWLAAPGTGARASVPYLPAFGWNPNEGVGLEFEGYRSAGTGPLSTWQWSAASGWVERTPTGLSPGHLLGSRMVWDPDRRRIVLFGGMVPALSVSGVPVWNTDIWEWDGARWQMGTTAGPVPPARQHHAMAYDSARRKVVVFGGGYGGRDYYCDTWRSDTWEWDGTDWAERTPATVPPARRGAAMAFDPVRGRTLLHGGVSGAYDRTLLHDTWEWDGTDWTPHPSATLDVQPYATAVHRAPAGGISLFAESDSVTEGMWDWTGTGWLPRATWLPPPGRFRPVGAWDSLRQRYVELRSFYPTEIPGRTYPTETWEFDGTQGIVRTPPGQVPLSRSGPAIAYDPVRQRTVLFGGFSSFLPLGETWEYETQADRRPGITFDASLAHARISVEQIRGLRARARCAGTAAAPDESGASLHAWAVGGFGLATADWVALTSNTAPLAETAPHVSGPGAELVWSTDSAAQARHLLRLDGLRIALQCRSRGISGAGDASVAADYFEIRVRYDAGAQ